MIASLEEYLLKVIVMTGAIWIAAAAAWWGVRKAGWSRPEARFDALDMRTWTLGFALIDAAVFAITFATASTWLGPVYCGAIAAVVAVSVVPLTVSRISRRATRDQ